MAQVYLIFISLKLFLLLFICAHTFLNLENLFDKLNEGCFFFFFWFCTKALLGLLGYKTQRSTDMGFSMADTNLSKADL